MCLRSFVCGFGCVHIYIHVHVCCFMLCSVFDHSGKFSLLGVAGCGGRRERRELADDRRVATNAYFYKRP